jgi:valyl-tRNA synthetase
MILEENKTEIDFTKIGKSQNLADEWILSAYYRTLSEIDQAYKNYNYALVSELLWDFIWNKFCDWYIEISKLNKTESLPLLVYLLTNILKMLHPFMPFITEEIWQKLGQKETIMLSSWPKQEPVHIKPEIEKEMDELINIIREIRNMRQGANIPLKAELKMILVSQDKEIVKTITKAETYIKKLAKINELILEELISEKPKNALASVIGETQIFLSLEGVIDSAKEKARLKDQLKKIESDINLFSNKLNNPGFVNNAPPEVIVKNKETLAKLCSEKTLLAKQLEQLS